MGKWSSDVILSLTVVSQNVLNPLLCNSELYLTNRLLTWYRSVNNYQVDVPKLSVHTLQDAKEIYLIWHWGYLDQSRHLPIFYSPNPQCQMTRKAKSQYSPNQIIFFLSAAIILISTAVHPQKRSGKENDHCKSIILRIKNMKNITHSIYHGQQ